MKIDQALPILYDIGFDILHPIAPECNDIAALRRQWAGKMAFVGNIPTLLLTYGSEDEIEERVRQQCVDLAPGGGYVLGSSPGIMEGIPPENFLAMVQAVHRYGRFRRLGQVDGTNGAQPSLLTPARSLVN